MNLEERSKKIRKLIFELSKQEGFGHVGSCLSCAEIMTTLFFEILKPKDRFILSKGHAAVALYAVLVELGIMDKETVTFLSEHPDKQPGYGIWCSTGSLGHGLPIGCGMALGGKRTYVLMSDGELDEGSNWEAIRFATEQKLSNLTAIIDVNGWQAYKKTERYTIQDKFKAFGWATVNVDGNRLTRWGKIDLGEALSKKAIETPIAIIAQTKKGNGWEGYEDTLESHYAKL